MESQVAAQKPKFKDVELGGNKYQIGKIPAIPATWIAMQILTKMLPAAVEQAFRGQTSGFNFAANRPSLSEEEFYNIQKHALSVCKRYDTVGGQVVAQPVFMASGEWAFADLADDGVTVLGLTAHSLIFNIAPFFDGDALKGLLAII